MSEIRPIGGSLSVINDRKRSSVQSRLAYAESELVMRFWCAAGGRHPLGRGIIQLLNFTLKRAKRMNFSENKDLQLGLLIDYVFKNRKEINPLHLKNFGQVILRGCIGL